MTLTVEPPTEQPDDVIWPAWGRRTEAEWAGLARFVSLRALVAAQLADAPHDAAEPERVAARFARLQREGIRYALEPWLPPRSLRQQIRDPRLLLRAKVGTCLDLATTFAAMCLEARVAPLLATNHEHAWVILRPGLLDSAEFAMDLAPVPGTSGKAGVLRVDDPDVLQSAATAGALLPVDAVLVTDPEATFEEARTRGETLLHTATRLVDVAWLLEHGGLDALPAPTRWPGIRPYVPGGRSEVIAYRSRPAPSDLVHGGGLVVLHGEQGSGKTTIARQLAVDAPHGAGWFLNASNRQALVDALAQAELNERDERVGDLSDQLREGYAFAALDRLRTADDPWVVVLDNADGAPSNVRGLLPTPRGGQLLVVTTTEPEWTAVASARAALLGPLDDDEIAAELGDLRLTPLVKGRPLVLEAYRSLLATTEATPATLATVAEELDLTMAQSGPRALWEALEAVGLVDDDVRRLAAIAALLPPDRQPAPLLERLSAAPDGAVSRLARCGLFTWTDVELPARLHRLFSAALRDALGDDRLDAAAITILQDAEARELLDGHGDPVTVRQLTARLNALDGASPTDPQLGAVLHDLAALIELKGDTATSAELYERAERHLAGDDDEELVMRANCLHGRARLVNQRFARDEPMLRAAIGWSQQAQAILRSIGRDDETGRSMAMEGLLLQKTAVFAAGRDARVAILEEALAIIVAADRLRRGALPPNHPERYRSHYNLAGINVALAKARRDRAAEHLDAAAKVYAVVGRDRRRIYDRLVHPHIAACENGLAIVNYYRALFAAHSAHDRTDLLRTATRHAEEALHQRQAFDGDDDLTDTRKTLALLAKIATARETVPLRAAHRLEPSFDEVRRELRDVGLLVPAVAPLTSGIPALEHVRAWVSSPALDGLVRTFGGDPVDASRPLGELLVELEAFADRWDYRAGTGVGAERSGAPLPVFSRYQELVVSEAAAVLGLDGAAAPPLERYDHVIVVDGEARDVLARCLASARLLRDGNIVAGSVIALAGSRDLSAREIALLGTVGLEGPRTELEAVDAGLRRAFGLEGPLRTHTLAADEEPAPWVVHGYDEETPRVHVVAAQAAPSGDWATAAACRWLVDRSGLAHRGESVLFVTTRHDRVHHLADAMRELADLLLRIDGLGIVPGEIDYRLAARSTTADYLQHIRATIVAYRALLAPAG